jgi:hypothetical protein
MPTIKGPRDFRNARRLLPSVTPPRLKFQGYVDFRFNPAVANLLDGNQNYRIQISSLVQRATLPSVSFQVATKKQYNHRRLYQTGVDYTPVSITVVDTVNNEWLNLLMNYFGHHYMQPRGRGSDRVMTPDASMAELASTVSQFGAGDSRFNSNGAGFDLKSDSSFFDQIDIILYHGGRGVQYSLMRPVLTSFKPDELDYTATADFMKFEMNFEYESFTVRNDINFQLNSFDLNRFETFNGDINRGTR